MGVAVILVVGSGFLHSIWNLLTKCSIDKNAFLWFCQLLAVLLFLPWAFMERNSDLGTAAALGVIMVSTFLHGLYIILLAKTYTVGDLSQVYPIMRGTSPLLVPVIGVLGLDESLSGWGWVGVIFIVLGIFLLSGAAFLRDDRTSVKAPLYALAVGICITGYMVVDKLALQYVTPVVLNEATNIGNLLALSRAAFTSKGMFREIKVNGKSILLGGIFAPMGYLIFLYALSLAPLSQLAPMREIGIVFGTLMGIWILRERQGGRRIMASFFIAVGVIVLGVWG